jgi:hypothetical protein
MTRDQKTVEWQDVPVPDLPRFLDSCLPICWNCHKYAEASYCYAARIRAAIKKLNRFV